MKRIWYFTTVKNVDKIQKNKRAFEYFVHIFCFIVEGVIMGEVYKEAIERLRKEIKKQLPEIEKNGDWLWNHPETGFKETETQKYCLEVLRQHGFEAKTWEDVTGFTCTYDTGKPGPCVMIMGEMDSLICRTHPDSDPQTGAAHACGHSVQTASAMGAFFALLESGVLDNFCGKVMLAGVPAEECVETECRSWK